MFTLRILKMILASSILALGSAAQAEIRVISGSAVLMDGPGTTYRAVQTLPAGTRVTLLESYEGYGLVQLRSGVVAWTRSGKLARPGAVNRASVAVAPKDVDAHTSVVWPKSGNLNLRAGPGLNHDVTMTMARGDIVEISKMAGKWAFVRCMTGETGWAHSAYLTR